MTRPKRKYVSMRDVGEFHGVDTAVCYRCKQIAQTERAHVIDRWCGGLDGVQNIVPLCFRCHREMPSFFPGEERRAWLWLETPDFNDYTWKLVQIQQTEGGLTPAEFECFGDAALVAASMRAGLYSESRLFETHRGLFAGALAVTGKVTDPVASPAATREAQAAQDKQDAA